MRQALRAEWTKLRTLPSSGWLMLASIVSTVALSAAAAAAVSHTSAGSRLDITRFSLTGIQLGQSLVAILAVTTMTNEYSNGMIRVTLAALPRRPTVLAAKAAVVGGVALVAGAVAVGGCLLVGRLVLPSKGFIPAHGYTLLSLFHEPTLRAAIGSIIYLALVGLLSLGIAAALRDSAAAIGAVLALLYLFPILAAFVGDPFWQRRLQQVGPSAGQAIQATSDLRSLPIGPWAGLGVLAAWAAATLLVGGVALRLRDT
jgi:ABC-2 type transport system permease protein